MKKAIIVYYSKSGNTAKLGDLLTQEMKQHYETHIQSLQATDESESFFGQAVRALLKRRARLKPQTRVELAEYDLICLGTPVWAFGPAPALRTFMQVCTGVANKPILNFVTYGSGAGKNNCISQMNELMTKKGARPGTPLLIQQFQLYNPTKVTDSIRKVLDEYEK